MRDDPVIKELAEKYKKTPTQIILSWHVGRKVVAVVKSANADRQRENIDVSYLTQRIIYVV